MATLDNSDFTDIKRRIKADPTARAVFEAWGLDKSTYKAMFQACENWFVNGFLATPSTSAKAALEVAAGAMTNGQAKQVLYVWGGWRYSKNP